MGCCGNGNQNNRKVKEWGTNNYNERSNKINSILIVGVLLLIGILVKYLLNK